MTIRRPLLRSRPMASAVSRRCGRRWPGCRRSHKPEPDSAPFIHNAGRPIRKRRSAVLARGACKLAAVFSTRLPWQRPENALARAETRAPRIRSADHDLTESNPTRVGLRYPDRAARRAGAVAADAYEPDPLGLRAARAAVAADYARRRHRDRRRPPGADRQLQRVVRAVVQAAVRPRRRRPGARAELPAVRVSRGLEGVRPIGYRLAHDGDDGTSTSTAWPRRSRAPAAAARARSSSSTPTTRPARSSRATDLRPWVSRREAGLAVISDEVFAPYVSAALPARAGDARLAAAPALAERVPTFAWAACRRRAACRSSSSADMAVRAPSLADDALARLELITDTYLSVGGPVQRALPGCWSSVPTCAPDPGPRAGNRAACAPPCRRFAVHAADGAGRLDRHPARTRLAGDGAQRRGMGAAAAGRGRRAGPPRLPFRHARRVRT